MLYDCLLLHQDSSPCNSRIYTIFSGVESSSHTNVLVVEGGLVCLAIVIGVGVSSAVSVSKIPGLGNEFTVDSLVGVICEVDCDVEDSLSCKVDVGAVG